MPQRNLLLLLLAVAVSYVCYTRGEQNPYRRYVANGLTAIEEHGLEPVGGRELMAGAMDGMVAVLRARGDQHSQFLSESEAGPLRNEIHQQFGGIGVRLRFEGNPPLPVIAGPIAPATPAGKAKLQPCDRILAINDEPTETLKKRDVLSRLTGEVGSRVTLLLQGPNEKQARSVELTRELIQIESIFGDRRGPDGNWLFALEDDPRVAQIRIGAFGDRTAQEFAAILPVLIKKGVQGIVIDVRDNAGGSLSSAVAICEMLLPANKTIVETRGRGQTLHERYATTVDGKYRDLPLAVIVNQNSASAAEIVAGCLQDHGRAIIIGQRSFGKGTVQQLLPLGDGLLKLTWASFWRPSGANVDRALGTATKTSWGVSPDKGFACELTTAQYAAYEDYRNLRDESELSTTICGNDESDRSQRQQDAAKFVDQAVVLAKRYLESKLNEKSENP